MIKYVTFYSESVKLKLIMEIFLKIISETYCDMNNSFY